MALRIGIDVGGTFTDAVLVDNGVIAAATKVSTPADVNTLLPTVLEALEALRVTDITQVEQITVSTTLMTNAILQNRLTKSELYLIPGYGMKLDALPWPVPYQAFKGQLDFRGREVEALDPAEIEQQARRLTREGSLPCAAIVGKFSHRNNAQELTFDQILRKNAPGIQTTLGHRWGGANFYRRALTAYLNMAGQELFAAFASELTRAIREKGYEAPVYVLKADGGVLPLEEVRPVDTIYSGPAASVLGALALAEETADSYLVIDVGGTTTDMGLVLGQVPLLSAKGAKIGGFLTQIRSLAVRSLPLGGDSVVELRRGAVEIQPYREGTPYCLGGPKLTPTDAMCYLQIIDFGDPKKAEEALMEQLRADGGAAAEAEARGLAQDILKAMTKKILAAMTDLEKEWREEPAYKIWQVLHPQRREQFPIWLSGGPAPGLVRELSEQSQRAVKISRQAGFANAAGAALARPAFSRTLHVDTVVGRYRIEETGEQGAWQGSKRARGEAERLIEEIMRKETIKRELEPDDWQKDEFDYFPVVDGYRMAGQIVRGSWSMPSGIIGRVKR